MSRLDTKQALITHLLANLPTGVTGADVAYENQQPPFIPEGKGLWVSTSFHEASSESTGQSTLNGNEQRGFLQIDINVPITSNGYDNQLLSSVDELSSAFKYGTTIVYNAQKVDILDSASPASFVSDAWYKRIISINYLTFSNK